MSSYAFSVNVSASKGNGVDSALASSAADSHERRVAVTDRGGRRVRGRVAGRRDHHWQRGEPGQEHREVDEHLAVGPVPHPPGSTDDPVGIAVRRHPEGVELCDPARGRGWRGRGRRDRARSARERPSPPRPRANGGRDERAPRAASPGPRPERSLGGAPAGRPARARRARARPARDVDRRHLRRPGGRPSRSSARVGRSSAAARCRRRGGGGRASSRRSAAAGTHRRATVRRRGPWGHCRSRV